MRATGRGPTPSCPNRRPRRRQLRAKATRWLKTARLGLIGLTSLAIGCGPGPMEGPATFKIYVTDSGVHRVTYEELLETGVDLRPVPSSQVRMTVEGRDVPVWVEDGGDGKFGPGDRVEFVGARKAGHRSHFDEYTLLNVYRLTVAGEEGPKMLRVDRPANHDLQAPFAHLESEQHIEENNFLVHFVGKADEAPEPRFWQRLSHIDPEPFRHEIWLGRGREGARPVALSVELRGWSNAGRSQGLELADHRVDLSVNGHVVGSGEWDGHEAHVIEVPAVPKEILNPDAANVIEISVPKRRPTPDGDAVIDVVLLNWIEVRSPHPESSAPQGGSWIPPEQQRLAMHRPDGAEQVVGLVTTELGGRVLVFGADGTRYDERSLVLEDDTEETYHRFVPSSGDELFYVARVDGLAKPAAIEVDTPSNLTDRTRQADYLMIAHPLLLDALEPLVEHHRQNGLEVAVVAVDDIYDEFNHSIQHPGAIKEFVSFAYHEWAEPAPRFVLLAGDASWDAEGEGGRYAGGRPYPREGGLSHRNLIPTWSWVGGQGRAASDNYFVSIDGDDHLPDLAIGRFPVAEPELVTAIVEKILSYDQLPVGPWRRKVLWLSDVTSYMRARSDRVAEVATERGFATLKLYPSEDAPSDAQTQVPLIDAFDDGQLLVHFLGHGARYVWRTGANRDHRNNYDLFTLEHLDELAPTDHVPLVLSMTCWSAPFDHPHAPSIGETFLSLDGRGALAFLGASWKVSANEQFSRLLVEHLIEPGTIGEGVMAAKRFRKIRSLVEPYNLLGDPAIELALPTHRLELATERPSPDRVAVSATVPEPGFTGRVIVDWLLTDGTVAHSESLDVTSELVRAEAPDPDRAFSAVRAYVWNEAAGTDGLGFAYISPESEPASSAEG